MKKNRKRGSDTDVDQRLPKIETYLENNLRPVAPREDFVNNLKSRLADPSYAKNVGNSNFYLIMLVLMAVSTTVLLVVGLIRLMIELFGALRMMRLFGRQADQKKSLSLSG
jgi:hypothetical protein